MIGQRLDVIQASHIRRVRGRPAWQALIVRVLELTVWASLLNSPAVLSC
jgi:hypothetical protein